MSRHSWLLLVSLVALGVGVFGGTGATATTPVLVVTGDDGTELLTVPVEDGTEVTIEYTHSVEKTLVSDVYVVTDGGLVMDRMLFSSYGAGLPSAAPITRNGDRYEYRPPDRRHETLTVSTGPIAGHELVVGEERYDLLGIAEGGTVNIRIETRFRPFV